MLEKKAYFIIKKLREVNKTATIVLLDYETNCDVDNLSKPLSHAFLVKAYVEGLPPFDDVIETKVHHHYYCGKKTISWTTEEKLFKEIPPCYQKDSQLYIEFDF